MRSSKRGSSFFVPLILVGAFLNMGDDCDPGPAKCQGKPVTHTFSTSGIATHDDDVILVTAGDVYVYALEGDDTVCVITNQPGVTVLGGLGNDEIHGGGGDDVLDGEAGNDLLVGGGGADLLYGGTGADTLEGGGGDDLLDGEGGDDWLVGGAGFDLLYGGTEADTLEGGDDDDYLMGGAGDDKLWGEDGNDRLWGEAGSNELYGGAGDDTLLVGDENWVLDGGPGSDVGHLCSFAKTFPVGVESFVRDTQCVMESEDVFSARLEVSMCDSSVNGAENHEGFMISLNGEEPETQFLGDHPASPFFPSGSTHVYDFLVAGELRDIGEISIRSRAPDDAFCLSRVRLGVNHFTASTTTAWKWLFDTGPMPNPVEADATLTYSLSDLRSNANWKRSNFVPLLLIAATGLDYVTLERLLESLIDPAIQGLAGWGGQRVSAEQGFGDEFGASTSDACNAETDPLVCVLDWSDPDEVCNAFPENMMCTADCNAYPDQWVCGWDWEALGLPMSPCVWRSGVCQFPSHADIFVNLHQSPVGFIDVRFLLKVSCSTDDNQFIIEPDKISVDVEGIIFRGHFIERRLLPVLQGMVSDFSQTVKVPGSDTCESFDPHFDRCGLWLGAGNQTRPGLPNSECP